MAKKPLLGHIDLSCDDFIKVVDDGKGNVRICCRKCGEPITETHEWGMSCKNHCYKAESEKALKPLKEFIADQVKNFTGKHSPERGKE